jgi:dihydrofolate reductase
MELRKPLISAVAAIQAKDRAIGKDNMLLWRLPGDLKRFKDLTTDHPIIMGRKTYESIGRALPGRTNIIVTSNKDFRAEGCIVCHDLGEALEIAKRADTTEAFIIGGAQIYAQALAFADRLYLTLVDSDQPADTFFPEYDSFSKVVSREAREETRIPYEFLILERP